MSKTTVKVRSRKWALFNKECKAASMRRDDFLNRVLPAEIELLGKIVACDEVGEKWLKRNWLDRNDRGDSDLQPISMMLSDDVLSALNAMCVEKRVPRDAFIDSALTYLTERLFEAAVVIKNPRNTRDLVGRVADVLNDPRKEIDDRTRDQFVLETVNEWAEERHLPPFSDDFYSQNLSFDQSRVSEERMMLELTGLLSASDTEKAIAKLADANSQTNGDSDA
jgi:hypothetical protein